jgi:hypothetical protein
MRYCIGKVPIEQKETMRDYLKAHGETVSRVRGNGPRPSRSYHQSLPLDMATHCRLYVNEKHGRWQDNWQWLRCDLVGWVNGKPRVRVIG